VEALQAVFKAPDAASRIKAGDDFLTKFADSEFKAIVLMIQTSTYQMTNDYEKMIVTGERALEADPQSFSVMLMLGQAIAQRTREFDLDREEKLARAEKFAKQAVEIAKTAPRPRPDITDEQWEAAKKDIFAQGHEVLGMTAMVRKKFDVAVAEFKLATETASSPDPATLVRLGHSYTQLGKYDEAVSILDKVMADTNVDPRVKQFAQAERARAVEAKSGGAKPATPPAPAEVEIKKP
jgi:tetratricopeptide (TPR) repeat protein